MLVKSRIEHVAASTCGIFLLAALSLAISGGPDYGRAGSVAGTYAGVLNPLSCTAAPSPTPTGRCGANSIGVFALTVPKSGSSTGPFVVFDQGEAYVGTITATADPKNGKITGLFAGSFTYQSQVIDSVKTETSSTGVTTTTTTYKTVTYSATASGGMKAKTVENLTRFGSSNVRLKGSADIQFSLTVNSVDDDIAYVVHGYQQTRL